MVNCLCTHNGYFGVYFPRCEATREINTKNPLDLQWMILGLKSFSIHCHLSQELEFINISLFQCFEMTGFLHSLLTSCSTIYRDQTQTISFYTYGRTLYSPPFYNWTQNTKVKVIFPSSEIFGIPGAKNRIISLFILRELLKITDSLCGSILTCNNISFPVHDDVIKWKHFPRYWPFVRGTYRSPVNSPQKRPVTQSFDVFFDLHPNKRLSKQWCGWWFETPLCPLWHHRNVIVLKHWGLNKRVDILLLACNDWNFTETCYSGFTSVHFCVSMVWMQLMSIKIFSLTYL